MAGAYPQPAISTTPPQAATRSDLTDGRAQKVSIYARAIVAVSDALAERIAVSFGET